MTAILVVYVIGFLEGTGAHAMYVIDGGLHAFRGFPLPSQVFLHLLLVLDPLVAYLVWRRRPAAPILAAAVMFGDLLVNWQGNWAYVHTHPSTLLRPYGLPVLTLFGLFVFATAVHLHREFRRSVA